MSFKRINFTDKAWQQNLVVYAGIFTLAISIRIWFAFFDGHIVIFNACDASEYIANAKKIQEFCHKPLDFWLDSAKYQVGLLTPETMSSLQAQYKQLLEVSNRSGVIYPLFLAISFWLFQVDLSSTDLFAPVAMQCLISSLVCVLALYLGTKLWNRQVGVISGLICSIYPGFIVNSARLVSESFAGFWFLLSLALIVKMIVEKKGNSLIGFALGLCLGIMQLARSAMLLITGVMFLTGLVSIKFPKAKKTLALATIGIAIVLGSFACFQNLVNGSPSIVVDRLSNYNLFTGLDLDGHGWLSYPYPNYANMESSSYFEIIKSKFDQGPTRFLQLLFDKPPRLLGFPWNDFKTPIGIFTLSSQVLFHQICLLLAAIGFCMCLFSSSSNKDIRSSQIVARCIVVLTLLAHFVYCAFVTLPRYALTATPCLILFSAAGLYFLLSKMTEKADRSQALILLAGLLALLISTKIDLTGIILMISPFKKPIIGLVLMTTIKALGTFMFFAALYIMALKCTEFKKATKFTVVLFGVVTACFAIPPLYAYGRPFEWKTTLNESNKFIEQKIQLPKSGPLDRGKYFLFIDSKNWQNLVQATQVSINGKMLKQAVIPVMPYVQYGNPGTHKKGNTVYYDLEFITSNIVNAVGGTNLDLRQWFMIPIPSKVVLDSFKNDSGIMAVRINGKSNQLATLYGSYIVKRNQLLLPGFSRYSFEKCFYGMEEDSNLSDIRYDDKFPVAQPNESNKDLSNSPGLQTGSYNIRILKIENTDQSEILEPILECASNHLESEGLSTALTSNANLATEGDIKYLATINGNIQSSYAGELLIPVNINAVAKGHDASNNQISYNSPWIPSRFNLTQGDNPIKFSFPINPSDLGNNLDSITVSINPGGPSDSNQFLGTHFTLENYSQAKLRWTELSIKLEKMKNWQVTKNFELY